MRSEDSKGQALPICARGLEGHFPKVGTVGEASRLFSPFWQVVRRLQCPRPAWTAFSASRPELALSSDSPKNRRTDT